MTITGELVAFFVLALIAIAGGILMLNLTKVMHMMISLVFTFLAIAGIYVLLSAEFVAVVQVLIYSGAITIIMLFGIMLTKHKEEAQEKVGRLRLTLILMGMAAFFFTMYFALNDLQLGDQATDLHINNTEQIGIKLYSEYVIPFELASVVLLVALIGAIILAKRDDKEEADVNE
jgi:NADH-quinone oxidoreductase subunit J